MTPEQVAAIDRVYIDRVRHVAARGSLAKHLIENWARMPVEVQCSSEFRYADPIVDEETLVVAITQSGETADTLAGVREARDRGAKVIAITNVVGLAGDARVRRRHLHARRSGDRRRGDQDVHRADRRAHRARAQARAGQGHAV